MVSTFRNCVLALGGAMLLSAHAVHAAPLPSSTQVDPLIALSLLGSAQSRAAMCTNSVACGPSVAAASAASTSASPAVATAAAAAAMQTRRQGARSKGMLELAAIIGVMLLIAIAAAAIAGGDDNEPVSPA